MTIRIVKVLTHKINPFTLNVIVFQIPKGKNIAKHILQI